MWYLLADSFESDREKSGAGTQEGKKRIGGEKRKEDREEESKKNADVLCEFVC